MEKSEKLELKITALLESPDEEVRLKTLTELSDKELDGIYMHIKRMASRDPSSEVRYQARKLLFKLKRKAFSNLKGLSEGNIDIESLKEELFNADIERRVRAIQLITMGKIVEALPHVKKLLITSDDEFIRATAVIAVAVLGGAQEELTVISCLKDEDHRVRANAIEALEVIGTPSAFAHIMKYITDEDHRVRANAIKALKRLGVVNIIKYIEEMISSNDIHLKDSAAHIILNLKDPSMLPLVERLMKDSDKQIREKARQAYEAINEAGILRQNLEREQDESENEVVRALLNRLKVADSLSKMDALKQLELAGDLRIADILTKILKEETEPKIKAYIISVLARQSDLSECSIFLDYLNDKDDRVRANAVEAIGYKGSEAEKAILIPYLMDQSSRVRANAIIALHDRPNTEALAELENMLYSSDPQEVKSGLYVIRTLKRPDLLKIAKIAFESANDRESIQAFKETFDFFEQEEKDAPKKDRGEKVSGIPANKLEVVFEEKIQPACKIEEQEEVMSAEKAILPQKEEKEEALPSAEGLSEEVEDEGSEKSVEEYLIDLNSNDSKLRWIALKKLSQTDDITVLSRLALMVNDVDMNIRKLAGEVLKKLEQLESAEEQNRLKKRAEVSSSKPLEEKKLQEGEEQYKAKKTDKKKFHAGKLESPNLAKKPKKPPARKKRVSEKYKKSKRVSSKSGKSKRQSYLKIAIIFLILAGVAGVSYKYIEKIKSVIEEFGKPGKTATNRESNLPAKKPSVPSTKIPSQLQSTKLTLKLKFLSNNKPVKNVSVIILPGNKGYLSNKNGEITASLERGIYTINAIKSDYEPVVQKIDLATDLSKEIIINRIKTDKDQANLATSQSQRPQSNKAEVKSSDIPKIPKYNPPPQPFSTVKEEKFVFYYGDLNGDRRITNIDYTLARTIRAGEIDRNDKLAVKADVNFDGRFDAEDLKIISFIAFARGDFDNSGVVTEKDIECLRKIVEKNEGTPVSEKPSLAKYDLDGDGYIMFTDLEKFKRLYNIIKSLAYNKN